MPDPRSHEIEWRCPACRLPGEQELGNGDALECARCGRVQPLPEGALDPSGALVEPLERCLACRYERLFAQKDFNRKIGLGIVVIGAVLSPWTYGASLVGCLLLDYGLYRFVPEITVCYGCGAIHRGFEHNPKHRAHDPLLAEKYRRQAVDAGHVAADDGDAEGSDRATPGS